jgi:hypothetical protein
VHLRPLPPNATLSQVGARVREIVRRTESLILYSTHALHAMWDDHLSLRDLETVLRGCAIVEREKESKFKAQGRTIDGAVVFVIVKLVELDTGLYVITVYRAEKRPEATKPATGPVIVVRRKRGTR